jgi:hypothetical protein
MHPNAPWMMVTGVGPKAFQSSSVRLWLVSHHSGVVCHRRRAPDDADH